MKRDEAKFYQTIRQAADEGRGVRLSVLETKLLAAQPFIGFDPWMLKLEWRKVPGYELYEVSSEGHIRRDGRAIRPTAARTGHLKVSLYNGVKYGKIARGWRVQVHRVAALAFLGPPPFPGAVVRHRNGHPSDNRAENLQWGTTKENAADRRHHSLNGKPRFVDSAWKNWRKRKSPEKSTVVL